MSLIKCQYCGKEISDKAIKCPACGFVSTENSNPQSPVKTYCEECNAEIPIDEDTCPNCGNPVLKESHNLENSSILPATLKKVKSLSAFEKCTVLIKNKKKANIIAATAVCLLIIGIITGQNFKSKRVKSNYQSNLNIVVSKMLEGGTDAETSGNLIKSVWYNTIYKKSNTTTNKYTKKNGSFNKDFNDSLSALFSDATFTVSINLIKSNQKSVDSLMKSLRNPPKGYEEAYNALKDLYDAYNELTGIVINPTGSLSTYSSKFNSADTNMSKCYKAVKVYTNS